MSLMFCLCILLFGQDGIQTLWANPNSADYFALYRFVNTSRQEIVLKNYLMMSTDRKRQVKAFAESYALSCAAAFVAETATYPLDLTKTRLQIQGEHLHSSSPGTSINHAASLDQAKRGMIRTAYGIVKEEGFFHLWQGVAPAVLRHFIYSGVRIGVYEQFRSYIFHRNPDGTFPAWFRGVVHAFSEILKTRGFTGLWKGVIPNCQRAALANMADLATYDKVKQILLQRTFLKDNYVTHGAASFCAGLACAIASTPADVIKTRIMNQPHDAAGHNLMYKNSLDCLVKTVRVEGVLALYKGFIPIWMRLGPWCLIFWMSYEKIRWLTGASSF